MRLNPLKLLAALLLVIAVPCVALPRARTTTRHSNAAVTHSAHSSHRVTRTTSHREPAQGMSSERATEIQNALIQHGYLTGPASGVWDAQSIAAMQKLQSDSGWQSKITPDSRALIKLGLGPAPVTAQASSVPAPPVASR